MKAFFLTTFFASVLILGLGSIKTSVAAEPSRYQEILSNLKGRLDTLATQILEANQRAETARSQRSYSDRQEYYYDEEEESPLFSVSNEELNFLSHHFVFISNVRSAEHLHTMLVALRTCHRDSLRLQERLEYDLYKMQVSAASTRRGRARQTKLSWAYAKYYEALARVLKAEYDSLESLEILVRVGTPPQVIHSKNGHLERCLDELGKF